MRPDPIKRHSSATRRPGRRIRYCLDFAHNQKRRRTAWFLPVNQGTFGTNQGSIFNNPVLFSAAYGMNLLVAYKHLQAI